jgi:hypothetical protein
MGYPQHDTPPSRVDRLAGRGHRAGIHHNCAVPGRVGTIREDTGGKRLTHRAVLFWRRQFRETNMDDNQTAPPGQVQIKADEKELQGMYSNLVMVHHHAEEFTLNFVYVFPNGAQGKLLASVIVSPGHAKRIWRALGENISRFEAQFGPIKEGPEGIVPGANIGFVQ